jgi:hypothetical protein
MAMADAVLVRLVSQRFDDPTVRNLPTAAGFDHAFKLCLQSRQSSHTFVDLFQMSRRNSGYGVTRLIRVVG